MLFSIRQYKVFSEICLVPLVVSISAHTPAARGKKIRKSATIVGDMADARIGHTPFYAQAWAAGEDDFGDDAALDWLDDDDVELSEAPAESARRESAAVAVAVLVADGPARAGRRNAQFKAEVCAAFNTIGLDAGSCLPPTHVLARDPDVLSGGLATCPRELWQVIQAHGGFVNAGRIGVSRRKIVNQFRLWKLEKFGQSTAVRQVVAPPPATTKMSTLAVLHELVPCMSELTAEMTGVHAKMSCLRRIRRWEQDIQLWASDACKRFWEAELGNTLMVVVDAVHDHLRDGMYIETHTHTGEPVRRLWAILEADDDAKMLATNCKFCPRRGAVCNCIQMAAYEAVEMFVGVVLRHVGYDEHAEKLALKSPPPDAIVPAGSVDALYNAAGALLCKVRKKTSFGAKGVTEAQCGACVAFCVVHAVSGEDARTSQLPVAKVLRTQKGADSLAFVSESLYNFFCRLELVYWVNLNLQSAAGLTPGFMQQLDAFAQIDAGVVSAWQRVMFDIVKRHHPGDCADTTAAGRKKLKAKLKQAIARSSFVFEMVARTYRNVRGKEFAATYAEQTRRAWDARQTCVRDALGAINKAAELAAKAAKAGGASKQ